MLDNLKLICGDRCHNPAGLEQLEKIEFSKRKTCPHNEDNSGGHQERIFFFR